MSAEPATARVVGTWQRSRGCARVARAGRNRDRAEGF